jgi:hypothetical protein
VISSLTASVGRIEVTQSVGLTAVVQDAESGPERLQLQWTATNGTFTGQGANVTWRPTADVATPVEPVLTLTVVESYQALDAQGRIVAREHRVTASVTVRVHNSERELGDIGRSFLTKFADSSLSPEACTVDFTDSCIGKRDEQNDIHNNRLRFQILSHQLGTPTFLGLNLYNNTEMLIPCAFESRIVQCLPGDESWCKVGYIQRVNGNCRLTGEYEQNRWWLCVSNFIELTPGTTTPTLRHFLGADIRR